MAALRLINGKTFGSDATVTIDGCRFVDCYFDGCIIEFSGGLYEIGSGCSIGRPVTPYFIGAAANTIGIIKNFRIDLQKLVPELGSSH